jgi:hypothetical protein
MNNWVWRQHKTFLLPTGNGHSNNSKFFSRRALKRFRRHTLPRANSWLAIPERSFEVLFNGSSSRSIGQTLYRASLDPRKLDRERARNLNIQLPINAASHPRRTKISTFELRVNNMCKIISTKLLLAVIEITNTIHWLYHSFILYTGSYKFRQ